MLQPSGQIIIGLTSCDRPKDSGRTMQSTKSLASREGDVPWLNTPKPPYERHEPFKLTNMMFVIGADDTYGIDC